MKKIFCRTKIKKILELFFLDMLFFILFLELSHPSINGFNPKRIEKKVKANLKNQNNLGRKFFWS